MGHTKEVYGLFEKANALAVEALSTRLLNQALSEEEFFGALNTLARFQKRVTRPPIGQALFELGVNMTVSIIYIPSSGKEEMPWQFQGIAHWTGNLMSNAVSRASLYLHP
jgi:hypothetical protein